MSWEVYIFLPTALEDISAYFACMGEKGRKVGGRVSFLAKRRKVLGIVEQGFDPEISRFGK